MTGSDQSPRLELPARERGSGGLIKRSQNRSRNIFGMRSMKGVSRAHLY